MRRYAFRSDAALLQGLRHARAGRWPCWGWLGTASGGSPTGSDARTTGHSRAPGPQQAHQYSDGADFIPAVSKRPDAARLSPAQQRRTASAGGHGIADEPTATVGKGYNDDSGFYINITGFVYFMHSRYRCNSLCTNRKRIWRVCSKR